MSLASQIRDGVAQAAKAIGGTLVTVTHEAKTGTDGDRKPTFGDPTTHQVFVTTTQVKVARFSGAEVVDGPTVIFLENKTVGVEDRITLPDGTFALIKAVDSTPDPDGGVYYAMALCGRPERGTTDRG